VWARQLPSMREISPTWIMFRGAPKWSIEDINKIRKY
jgi:hypothetical protein